MKVNRYPQWDDEILRLYEEGWSMRRIGKHIGWSENFVSHRLHHHGAKVRKRGGVQGKRETNRTNYEELDPQILRLWDEGFTAVQIGQLIEYSPSFVRLRLRKHDRFQGKRRYPADYIPHEEITTVVFMYERMEMTMREISDHFGWKKINQVRSRLKKAGVQSRSKTEVAQVVAKRRRQAAQADTSDSEHPRSGSPASLP